MMCNTYYIVKSHHVGNKNKKKICISSEQRQLKIFSIISWLSLWMKNPQSLMADLTFSFSILRQGSSHYVDLACPELKILLLLPPECWDYRCEPPYLALHSFVRASVFSLIF
jgi:hypothetical protein